MKNNEDVQDLYFIAGYGLRGIIGNGSNRLNQYTVGKASQGLANYILKEGTQDKGVAIAYDSRFMSPEFAEVAGLIFAANGIPAFVYPSLRPVPMLSFAVRELGCTAGVVLTASHNPPEYNGYKVYWADGAQVVAPRDKGIITEVNAVTDFGMIQRMDRKEAEEYISAYFARYPKIKGFMDDTIKNGAKNGYVATLWNRRRAMPELQSSNFIQRAAGERAAMNMPLQGTAADVIKIAMINVHKRLKTDNFAQSN